MTSSSGPAYSRIAAEIVSRIRANNLGPGARLPAERELAEEFGVARMTVRQALDQLQLDGLIGRRRGRSGGSFVLGNRPVVELTRKDGFISQLKARGHEVDSEVLLTDEVKASALVASKLGLITGVPVIRIVRLLRVDDTPILIEDSYLPSELVPGILDLDLNRSLYGLLRFGWELVPTHKEEVIAPGAATPFEQQHLGVSASMPLLRIHRVTWDTEGRILEYSEDVLRSDTASVLVTTDL